MLDCYKILAPVRIRRCIRLSMTMRWLLRPPAFGKTRAIVCQATEHVAMRCQYTVAGCAHHSFSRLLCSPHQSSEATIGKAFIIDATTGESSEVIVPKFQGPHGAFARHSPKPSGHWSVDHLEKPGFQNTQVSQVSFISPFPQLLVGCRLPIVLGSMLGCKPHPAHLCCKNER